MLALANLAGRAIALGLPLGNPPLDLLVRHRPIGAVANALLPELPVNPRQWILYLCCGTRVGVAGWSMPHIALPITRTSLEST
jgi:hypothetical protein